MLSLVNYLPSDYLRLTEANETFNWILSLPPSLPCHRLSSIAVEQYYNPPLFYVVGGLAALAAYIISGVAVFFAVHAPAFAAILIWLGGFEKVYRRTH